MRLLLATIALLVLVGCSMAMAQPLGTVTVYECPDGVIGAPTELAGVWKQLPFHSDCNADQRIPVCVCASLAQWMRLDVEATELKWRIMKPGEYAADGIGIQLVSNGDVGVTFSDFADLVNPEGDIIEAYYAAVWMGDPPPGPNDWIRAADLNSTRVVIDELQNHAPISIQLWNRLKVVICDSACEYYDTAWILVRLEEQKPWIIRETGEYDRKFDPPPPYPTCPS